MDKESLKMDLIDALNDELDGDAGPREQVIDLAIKNGVDYENSEPEVYIDAVVTDKQIRIKVIFDLEEYFDETGCLLNPADLNAIMNDCYNDSYVLDGMWNLFEILFDTANDNNDDGYYWGFDNQTWTVNPVKKDRNVGPHSYSALITMNITKERD